jgi:hypothetical protein
MRYLVEKNSTISTLIENQFPYFVQENNSTFINFLTSYYESLESKYQPLDIATNLVDYYNIGYYTPNQLIEETTLSSNLSKSSTVVSVSSTVGFPEKNGYIRINKEIIFYKTKTLTSFNDCVRGTSALILENIPKSQIVLVKSTSNDHKKGQKVENIAYLYSREFFSRIKSEIAPFIPENLSTDLNISEFLKKIKSFYSAKGSLNSHRILFKILFNDKKFKFLLKPAFTSKARIEINNYNGFIPKDPPPTILFGGSGYDGRKDQHGNLINPPIIDVIGSGTGEVKQDGLQPNDSAVVVVEDIDSNGSITSIEVLDSGKDYVGPIISRVREKIFKQDQRVRNISGTGYGHVEFWDSFANEIILYDVVGYFKSGDEIIVDGGENPRAFIDKALAETEIIDGEPKVKSFRDGVSVLSETQNIEFPQEYTFKTSNSQFNEKIILKCKLVEGSLVDINKNKGSYVLIQDSDTKFGVNGASIGVDNVVSLRNNEYEFEVSGDLSDNSIYLNSSTRVTLGITGVNSNYSDRYVEDPADTRKYFTITVDDASRFPLTNGRIFINGKVIDYKNRSFNQFFECTYDGEDTFNLNPQDEVISWGRKIYDLLWTTGLKVTENSYIVSDHKLYKSINSGTTGSVPPTHTSGVVSDGSFDLGDSDFVEWEYVSSNINNYYTYVKNDDESIMAKFYVVGLPHKVVIEDGGSLHSSTVYEFADFDSPNTNIYRFLDSDLSNSLAVLLSTNFNKNRSIVTDTRLPSYKNLIGFTTQHDFDEYIYVPSSAIPPWWNNIVPNLPAGPISESNFKKLGFKNQKLLSRWKKSGLVYDTQAIGTKEPTRRAIGLDISAIQLNSYKGNIIEYGILDRFIIGDGGDYKVPISNGKIDKTKLPKLVIDSTPSEITVSGDIFRLSSKISKINFSKLAEIWSSTTETSSNLSGFSSKPSIMVVNNNPVTIFSITQNNITFTNETDPNHNTFTIILPESDKDKLVDTSEFLTVLGPFLNGAIITDAIPTLVNSKKYYVRKISEQTFGGQVTARYSLHLTATDSILNQNKVSLKFVNTPLTINVNLKTEVLNPSDFVSAELDVSYNKNTGKIDNIIVINSGNGYVEAPQIIITGGGKLNNSNLIIPYSLNGNEIIELRGKLTSFENFYKEDNYEITNFVNISTKFDNAPRVLVDYGSGAEAVAYTSDGSLNSVIVIKRGKNYLLEPIVNVIGNGNGAQVRANIENGQIIGFTIVNRGTGYTQPVKIEIVPDGSGASVSSRLKQWNFNLVHRFSMMNRIDPYGGYVYHPDDVKDLTTNTQGQKVVNIVNNPNEFKQLDIVNNLPSSINDAQYLLFRPTQKLIVDYTRTQRNPFIKPLYPNRDLTSNPLSDAEVLSLNIHSAAIAVSYDGIPIYGNKGYSVKYDLTSQVTEIKSRYKLKYSQTASEGSQSFTYNGSTYYINRIGGPSVLDYPIGSFIEDFEFVQGTENDLDVHNGRFCVTPEFTSGRYCYFATLLSFDPITNYIVENSNINYGGFPYYIGDTFASTPDNYTNNSCRTNDKIPSVFTRIFEKNIPSFSIPGVIDFEGITKNDFYPSEKTNFDKTKLQTKSLLRGSVDSVIIESAGKDYKIGDKLKVDNFLSGGTGFSGFVSRVTGKKITNIFRPTDRNNYSIEFQTETPHDLTVGDYVYFDYEKSNTYYDVYLYDTGLQPSKNIQESSNISVESAEKFKDKKFYTLYLNLRFKYAIKIPELQYILSYDLDKINEYFVESVSSDEIRIDASTIPNNLYLHIGNYIYEIIKTNDFYNQSPGDIVKSVTSNKFTIRFSSDTFVYETKNLIYSTKSRSAKGSIVDVTISNGGSGYKKLPEITDIISSTGSGGIIQAYSTTIGKIKNIKYSNVGGGLTSNLNIKYNVDLPTTAKIINNFEIYEVEVLDGGFGYGGSVNITVNGQSGIAQFNIIVQTGIITGVEVINGGTNFLSAPILEVVASNGSGAKLRAKIRRKNIFSGQVLTLNPGQPFNSSIFPVSVRCEVINFDQRSSTIEFDEFTGELRDGDVVYTTDGLPYGKIVNIKRSVAYSKVNPFIKIERSKRDIYGNTSEYLQKITDSNYYQDWSYLISSSRDTKEWKSEVLTNTHPAGHKLFGKKVIERRKFFFENPEDVFKSSVIFTTNLNNVLDLKLNKTPCVTQSLTINNISFYSVNDYIYGTISESIGKIVRIDGEILVVELQNNKSFITGEVVVKVPPSFVYGLDASTFKHIAIWEGIFQEPEYSFEVATADLTFGFSEDILIPKFNVNDGEEILDYQLTTPYEYMDHAVLNQTDNKIAFQSNGIPQEVTSNTIGNFIISVGGSIQNPFRLRVQENTVFFDEPVKHDNTRVFAIKHSEFKLLTFTGNDLDDEYTLNYDVTDNCKLIVFYDGINQSHLITNYEIVSDNTIRFNENVEKSKIFGWFIDEEVDCKLLASSDFTNFRVTSIRGCSSGTFSKFIHSSAVKHPSSLYEIRKELLDGTVYADSDRTTVYGFDSNFTYTSPKFSKSYIEVLDPIQFNGSAKTFSLKLMGDSYSPKNGEKSTVVYVNNNVLDHDSYTILNDTITFTNTYFSSDRCIIADFISSYTSNISDDNCEILDRLNVVQNGTRKTFNMSNNGVPLYARNPGDIFVLKNNKLKRPELRSYKQKQDSETQSIIENKFTFVNAPLSSDILDFVYFNRQLEPEPTKNVILDDFRCFNGTRTEFPLTLDGKLYYPQYTKNLFVVRNGVYQKPVIDYNISGANIVFTTPPIKGETVFTFHSFDGLNQNIFIDTFKMFDGIQSDFALTRNFISSYLDNNYDIMVYRNGVYQHPDVDYTVLNKQTGPHIRFFTAPVPSDDIYIVNFNLSNNDDLIDVTSRFTQVDQYTIAYNNASPNINKDVFIVYLNGILQVNDSWQYNSILDEITFAEPVNLNANKVTIFAFKNKKRNIKTVSLLPLDSFKKFDGVQTKFALTKNYIETSVLDEINLQVYRNGVYQYPNIDYIISDSNNNEFIVGQNTAKVIEFTTAPSENDSIFINNITTDDIVNITSRFTQFTANSLQYTNDLQNPVDTTLLLIYRNGTLQDTWSYSSNILLFSENVNILNDNLKIYAFKSAKRILDVIKNTKLDEFRYFDSQTKDFSLTYNYINDTVFDQQYLHVFRNGVYQYESIDYNVITGPSAKNINFTTAPDATDEIFVVNYSTNDVIDITSRFTQLTTNSLQYTENVSASVDKSVFVIYLNGILQVDSWSYDTNTDVLTLDENIDLANDKVKIFGFIIAKIAVDTFTIQENVSSYPLLVNGTLISLVDAPLTETDVVVSIAGVLQEPGKTYVINGRNIEIAYNALSLGSSVSVYVLGRNYDARVLDSFDDNFTKNTFKLQSDFKSYNVFGPNNLQVIKNNVVLTSLVDYIIGNGYITFTQAISENDTIDLYVKQYILSQNGNPITSNYPTAPDLLINTNGVVQQPEVVYTVDTNILTLVNPSILGEYDLNIYQIATSGVEVIDYLNDSYDKNTFKLTSNYVYYNVGDSGSIFVYKNDQLLINNVDYTYGNGYITFVSSLLETDRIFISPYNYNLIDILTNSIISTNLPNTEEDLLLNIEGVCQNPGVSYEVNGSILTLLNAPELVNPDDYSVEPVYIYQVGSDLDDVSLMDYLDDNYSKSTYKLAINYKSFYPPNIGDIFILRNGVLQNPVEDFVIGNGYITFTTNITQDDDLFIMYTHGAEEINITNITPQIFTLGDVIEPSDYKNVILNINGAPKFYDIDFIISGNVLTLNEPLEVDPNGSAFILKYPSITFLDDINDCPDGERTRFKLLYTFPNETLTNLIESDIQSHADILVSINGIVQYPGVQYTLNSTRTFIDFAVAPQETDEIFLVRMSGNEVVNLSLDSNRTYSLSSATTNNLDNLVVFSNNQWKFEEKGEFTFNSTKTKVTLSQLNTSQYVFGIKFIGVFGLLDQIHTPYNGSRKLFNMFVDEENFVPVGTILDDNTPDETSILITKNGKILDPKVDYTLTGDIESQILFVTAPSSTDIISVKSVGSFLKLDTITTGLTGKTFNLKLGGNNYYPNSDISRPREHENQILVLRNGEIQNPIYDYYIDDNKLVFNNNLPAGTTKLVILDFRGTRSDVEVFNRFNQISVGDEIYISGEIRPRKVTSVLSPTVLKTESYTETMPSGAVLSASYSSGKVTDINVLNGGIGYEHPTVIRTKGGGVGAKAIANVEFYDGGVIRDDSVEIQYPGHNVYSTQIVLPTAYASSYKQQSLTKSQIRKATKLTNTINSTIETIELKNTSGMDSNTPVITVSSLTGSGAQFKIFVSKGSIRKVEILNSGIGYDDRSIDIKLVGGGGTGCVLEPVLDPMGRFTSVIVRNGGTGYDTFRVVIYDPNDVMVDPEFIEYTYVTTDGIDGCTRGSGAESYSSNTMVYFDSYL